MDMATEQILEKLNQMEKQFDKVDNRFNQFEDHVNKHFDEQEKRINKRFDEQKLINERFANKLLEHDKRFDGLEKQIAVRHNEIINRFDSISSDIEDLKQEYTVSNMQYKRLNKKVEGLAKKLA